ncbi:MAG: serine/threonine protein kinase [Chloroflexota bacterium]
MSNLIGQSLGRYHILEQLGEGGMATVYKAYDTRLERDVAIKIIRRGAFPPDQLEHLLKRFEREAKSLAKLSHPHIVGVIDYGKHKGSPYLVMEYLPGGTLKRRVGKPIPWQVAAQILIPIARALEYAHERNIVHRDVKPSNILLTDIGQPMLTDFGIAKILETEANATITGTGIGVGTPEYMAPEQWSGGATALSDIYSLGIVFYEMVTGRKPYMADTPAAILLKQATEPLPRPTTFVPDIPESVEKVLVKALARNPQDRYQNMKHLTTAMEELIMRQQAEPTASGVSEFSALVSDTYATVEQEDSHATRMQEATYDAKDTSMIEGPARLPKETYASEKKGQQAIPVWRYVLGAGFGGLVILLLCIGVAFSSRMIGGSPDSSQVEPSPLSVVQTEAVVFPTNTLLPPNPTQTQIFPTSVPTLASQFDPENPEGFLQWYFHSVWTDRNYDVLWDYISIEFRERLGTNYSSYVENWEKVGSVVEPITITFVRKDGNIIVYRVKYTTLSRSGGLTDSRNDGYYLFFNSSKGHWEFK